MQQVKAIVEAAKRLIATSGTSFTTQELVKEAGVAMQTFYRHFPGKDHLLMAVIEDLMTEHVARYEEEARDLTDPLARLRRHILGALASLESDGYTVTEENGYTVAGPRFITAEHWRLYQRYPEEMTYAIQPYTDLIARELRAAQEAGLLPATDPNQAAALVAMLVRSVYHHYAFADKKERSEVIGEQVWEFCLAGLGGRLPDRANSANSANSAGGAEPAPRENLAE